MTSKFPYAGKKILLVEDHVDNQELMKDIMEVLDCSLDVASDGEEAIAKWQANTYDLIIMDIHMPKMDGYQTSEAIRKLENGAKRVPILALTASALTHDREKCFRSGMDDYLSKPINIDILEKKLCCLFAKFS